MEAQGEGSQGASIDTVQSGGPGDRRLFRFLRLIGVGAFLLSTSYFIVASLVRKPGLLVAGLATGGLVLAVVVACVQARAGKVDAPVRITSYSLLGVVIVVAPFVAFEYATFALTCAFAATIAIAFGEPRQARNVILAALATSLYALFFGLWWGHTTDLPEWARHSIVVFTVLVQVYLISYAMMQLRERLTAMLNASKASSRRLEAACARARDADRRKDDFLAMLGHELRNPLSPIALALELMRDECGRDAERERAIIERQVAHMTRLVDDLLDTSRITRGKLGLERRIVELAPIVREAVDMTRSAFAERAQTLAIDVPDQGVRVFGDPTRLAQVICNLLVNGSKYTPDEGHVWLRAEASDGTARIVVEDDGMGMSADALATIFEPFVQGRERQRPGGLGLGLSLARSLVELHGGRIEVASDGPGRGSRFTVSLPLADERAMEQAPVERRAAKRTSTRVLVVDDNDDAATMLALALERRGFDVRIAHDGREALGVASEFDPEIAVLDIGLPEMDGYELAERMREEHHDHPLKLIALTGYGQPSDHERSAKAGFSAHLVKPVDLAQLERCLT